MMASKNRTFLVAGASGDGMSSPVMVNELVIMAPNPTTAKSRANAIFRSRKFVPKTVTVRPL